LREIFAKRGLQCKVARKDGERYHDTYIVSVVLKPETITKRIIKKPVVVDVA
jgi:hypothetical protein